jgi:uncharacterized protein YbjT (DUF2867 family)
MILVTTAGKVGSAAALALADADVPVRVLVRDPDRHRELENAGVALVAGDLDDPAGITRAVEDVTAVILVSLADPEQEIRVIDAAAAAGVRFIVKASSKASFDSPIARRRGQAEIEAHLAESGIPFVLLRSNAYMQNLLALAPVIAGTGAFASSAANGRVGLVDARDVGEVAATVAADWEGHRGATYWLTGPELLSYADVAEVLSGVLGRAVIFTARTAQEDEAAMIDAGVPAAIAAQNAQAFTLIADGDAEWLSDDVATLLHRPARSIQQFATDHAAAFTEDSANASSSLMHPRTGTRTH